MLEVCYQPSSSSKRSLSACAPALAPCSSPRTPFVPFSVVCESSRRLEYPLWWPELGSHGIGSPTRPHVGVRARRSGPDRSGVLRGPPPEASPTRAILLELLGFGPFLEGLLADGSFLKNGSLSVHYQCVRKLRKPHPDRPGPPARKRPYPLVYYAPPAKLPVQPEL
jgi:hypothetical protein